MKNKGETNLEKRNDFSSILYRTKVVSNKVLF